MSRRRRPRPAERTEALRPPSTAHALLQLAKYALVGAANTLITLGIYTGLIAGGVGYLLASAIGYALGSANSYVLNYHWTFAARGISHRDTLTRFAVVQGIGIASNLGLMYAFVHGLRFAKVLAQIAVTLVVLSFTFALNKLWAFAGARSDAGREAAGWLATVHASDLR